MKDTRSNQTFWDEYREDVKDIRILLNESKNSDILRDNFVSSVNNFVNEKRDEFKRWLFRNNFIKTESFLTIIREMEAKIPEKQKQLFWQYTVLCFYKLSELPQINLYDLKKTHKHLWDKRLMEIDKKVSKIFTEEEIEIINFMISDSLGIDQELFKENIYLSFEVDPFYSDFHSLSESIIYINKQDKQFHIIEMSGSFEGDETFIRPGSHAISHIDFFEYMRVFFEDGKSSKDLLDCAIDILKIISFIDTSIEVNDDELELLALSFYNNIFFRKYTLDFFERMVYTNLLEIDTKIVSFRVGKIPVYDKIKETYLKNRDIEFAF